MRGSTVPVARLRPDSGTVTCIFSNANGPRWRRFRRTNSRVASQGMLARYGLQRVRLSSRLENTQELRGRIESGEVAGPRIRSTGEGLISPGAMPSEEVTRIMGLMATPLPEVADSAQAVSAARGLLDRGVDGIKVFLMAGGLSAETIRAVAEEAHRRGKPCFAHPTSGNDVHKALANGVDVIAHTTPHSGPWESAIFSDLSERQAALTPTLWLWKYFMRHDRVSAQDAITDVAVDQPVVDRRRRHGSLRNRSRRRRLRSGRGVCFDGAGRHELHCHTRVTDHNPSRAIW